jgi:hypothetical protein
MADEQKQLRTWNVKCHDNTRGRISAATADEAQEMAAEMCSIHGGAGEPRPRTE